MKLKHIFFLSVLMIAFSANIAIAHASGYGRSMWVWEGEVHDALRNSFDRQTLLDFSAAKNIKTLYLYADSYPDGVNDVTDNPHYYRSFINEAHSRGMEVHALLGSMYLETWEYFRPERRDDALAMVSNVLNYNEHSTALERFDGFNVDIEPYVIPNREWWDNQPLYSTYYLDMLWEQKQLIVDSGQDMKFGPCIPRWYDAQPSLDNITWGGATKPLYKHILDLGEYVSIMDYQTSHISIYWDAYDELIYADALSHKVVIGVETQDPYPEPAWISFYGYTEEEMEAVLAAAEVNLATHPSYDGYAIHYYGTYMELTAIPEPATLIMFSFGLMGLARIRKRLKSAS